MTDPARQAALEVLTAVREQDAYTNLVLPAVLRRHGLTGRDAGLVTELASGTVRRQGTYDAVLTACVDRPLRRLTPDVLDVLRLGTHQLLATRVPPQRCNKTFPKETGPNADKVYIRKLARPWLAAGRTIKSL